MAGYEDQIKVAGYDRDSSFDSTTTSSPIRHEITGLELKASEIHELLKVLESRLETVLTEPVPPTADQNIALRPSIYSQVGNRLLDISYDLDNIKRIIKGLTSRVEV